MGSGASSRHGTLDGTDDDMQGRLAGRQLSRSQVKYAAARMLAAKRGLAGVAFLSQHAATCSGRERAVLLTELNELTEAIQNHDQTRRTMPTTESKISGGLQVCKCRPDVCRCLCIYCGEHGHSSKLCTRRVQHAAPPEASGNWLGAARNMPPATMAGAAPTKRIDDVPSAAQECTDGYNQHTTEMTDLQRQRQAEQLATFSVLELQDELKVVPHCAALKRVNELVEDITLEEPLPMFWPTLYCGEHGHSSKLCTRRVQHAAPPEASGNWLGAARNMPPAAMAGAAPTKRIDDVPSAAQEWTDGYTQHTTEMTDLQRQRQAEQLATFSMLELRDELKLVPHCAALKRVNELVEDITLEEPLPMFWPTPARTAAAENAVAKAQTTLQGHTREMELHSTLPVSVPAVSRTGHPITPEVVDSLSQSPTWQNDHDRKTGSPRAHEVLMAKQEEYAALHSNAQETWFEHYRAAVSTIAPRHDVGHAGNVDAQVHDQLLEDKLRGIFTDELQQLELEEALSIWDTGGIMLDSTIGGAGVANAGTKEGAPAQTKTARGKLSRDRSSNKSFRRAAVQRVQTAIHQQNRVGELPLRPLEQHEQASKRQELADWLLKNKSNNTSTVEARAEGPSMVSRTR